MTKQLKLTSLLLLLTSLTFAQAGGIIPGVGIVVKHDNPKPRHKGLILLAGGGINTPGSLTKEKSNALNEVEFSGSIYVPLIASKGWDGKVQGKAGTGGGAAAASYAGTGKSVLTTFGVNAGFQYAMGNGNYSIGNYVPYNIVGQTTAPTIAARGAGTPKSQGFKFEAGPQMNIHIGNVVISPILNVGYFSLTQKAMSVVQTSIDSNSTNVYNLYNQSETKTSGFAFLPKLRLSYFPGRLGFWVEGNYTAGPTMKVTATEFKPAGSPVQTGYYMPSQMETGTNNPIVKEGVKYTSIGINVGVCFRWTPPRNTRSDNGYKNIEPEGPKHGLCYLVTDHEGNEIPGDWQETLFTTPGGGYPLFFWPYPCILSKTVNKKPDVKDLLPLSDAIHFKDKKIIFTKDVPLDEKSLNLLNLKNGFIVKGEYVIESNEKKSSFTVKISGVSKSDGKKVDYEGHVASLR